MEVSKSYVGDEIGVTNHMSLSLITDQLQYNVLVWAQTVIVEYGIVLYYLWCRLYEPCMPWEQ